MTLRDKSEAKRQILATLEFHAELLKAILADAPMTFAPSSGRNVDVRRFDDAMNQRKMAAQLGLEHAVLRIGRARYTINPTPIAHENMHKAFGKLPVRCFDRWSYEFVDQPLALAA